MLPSLKKKRLLLPEAGPWLSPAHRQMPAEGALRRLAQDALVLFEFARNERGFRPQSGRIIFEKGDQRANSDEPADRVKPLWLWKVFRPVWISGTFHCGCGRCFAQSGSPAPWSRRSAMEFSSAEKNSSRGLTRSRSASRSRESSFRASAWPLTKMSKPGSSPSTTMYKLAAISLSLATLQWCS